MTSMLFFAFNQTSNIPTTYFIHPTKLLFIPFYDIRTYLRINLQSRSCQWLGKRNVSSFEGHGPTRSLMI